MEFALIHLLGSLLRPGTILVLCATVGLVLPPRRIGRALLTLGVIGLFAIVVLPIHQWVLLPLEDRFARPLPPAHVDGIIVLGGAIDTFVSAERGIPSLNAAAERMTEWVALARAYPQARVVFSGGIGDVIAGGVPEADVARQLATELGLPDGRVIYEGDSRTTYENAVNAKALAKPMPGESWLLVTSASHMPRAVGVFRHVGWPVIAWPVGYKTVHRTLPTLFEPLSDRLTDLDIALHEWGGLLYYRLVGRSDALFPSP